MAEVFVNKVAESGLITLDLETFYPKGEWAEFDLKDFLFMGLILKEKDYREQLKGLDWSVYNGKHVAVHCSADAVIPVWAYMLAASYLSPIAASVVFGNIDQAIQQVLLQEIALHDVSIYQGQRVVVKGCGEKHIGEAAYLSITAKLRIVARSVMYGEPCSTVPIFKQKSV